MTIGTDNLFVELDTEWRQLWGHWNWYTFTFFHLSIENETWTGGASLEIAILGVSAHFRWNYDPLIVEEMKKEADEELKNNEK